MESKYLNPQSVLHAAGLKNGETVSDLGAGSGFFALGAAKIVGKSGHVYAVDVLEKPLEHIASEARLKNLSNVKTIRMDLEKGEIKSIPTGTIDLVVVSNVLHAIKNPVTLLSECYRQLKTSGRLLIIDWSIEHALGPNKKKLLQPEEVKSLTHKFSFKFESEIETDKFHFGLMFIK